MRIKRKSVRSHLCVLYTFESVCVLTATTNTQGLPLTLFTHERRLGCQLLRRMPELARMCLAHMWSVLAKHLLTKHDAAVRECVEANVADYELVNPQLTAVYAARPVECHVS